MKTGGRLARPVLGPVLWAVLTSAAPDAARAQCPDGPDATPAPSAEGRAAPGDRACEAGDPPGAGDADGWLRHGLALAAAERYDEARSAFAEALALAPGHLDARLGLARLAFWQGRLGEAERHARLARAIDPGRRDIEVLLGRIDAARPRLWRIDLDAGVSRLSDGRAPWRESGLRIGFAATPATTVTGALDASERFGSRDVYVEGRVDHQASDSLSAYLALGGAPDATFLPALSIRAGGAARVSEGGAAAGPTLLTLHGRYAFYPATETASLMPGIAQYVFGGRLRLAGQLVASFDPATDLSTGYLVRARVALADAVSVHVGWSDAPEADAGVVADVRTVFGGLAIGVSDGVTLRLAGAHERRSGAYTRTSATLGITLRF